MSGRAYNPESLTYYFDERPLDITTHIKPAAMRRKPMSAGVEFSSVTKLPKTSTSACPVNIASSSGAV
jgi:hypothetical protein